MENRELGFGPFRLELDNMRLWRGKRQIKLKKTPLAVLSYLVSRPDQLVTKDALLIAVWEETVVSDATLAVCIRELRKALGDNAKRPRFIETVYGKGYRFVADVESRKSGEEEVQSPKPALSKVEGFKAQIRQSPILRFVGREAELEKLNKSLGLTQSGNLQVIFVTGEPGIGKTALVQQFLSALNENAETLVIHGQCVEQYGEGSVYLPVLDALNRACLTADGQPIVRLLEQHAPLCATQLPALGKTAAVNELSPQLILNPENRLQQELSLLLEALSREYCVIFILEDLQWSDGPTLNLLAHLIRHLGNTSTRCLIIGAYRPAEALADGHPLRRLVQELGGHRRSVGIELPTLSTEAIAAYVDQRFVSHAFPSRFAEVLHDRTGGNPLFLINTMEELIEQDVLVEADGMWSVKSSMADLPAGVPVSLRLLVNKQMDRLLQSEQQFLAASSMGGAEFSAAAIAAALDCDVMNIETLGETLADRQAFIRRAGIDEWPDGTVAARYGFQHAVYQQLWHERVSINQRRQWHRRIGERLEHAYGQRAGEIAPELALHFEQGGDHAKAGTYLLHAGETALRRNGFQEAITHLTKGMKTLEHVPVHRERTEREAQLQLALGYALVPTKGFAAPEVQQACSRALELYQDIQDPSRSFSSMTMLWTYCLFRADYRAAQQLGQRILINAQQANEPLLLIRAHAINGLVAHVLGHPDAARQHFEHSIQLYDPEAHAKHVFETPMVGPALFACFAPVLWQLGYPDQARRRAHEAVTLAEQQSHPYSQVQALSGRAMISRACGDVQSTQRDAEACVALATKHGLKVGVAESTALRGWSVAQQGQCEEGIMQIRFALAGWKSAGAITHVPLFHALLGEAYMQADNPTDGVTEVKEGLATVREIGENLFTPWLEGVLGDLLLASGNQSDAVGQNKNEVLAEQCFTRAIATAQKQQAKSWELRATLSLARLWLEQGKCQEAATILTNIYDWFTEGFDSLDLRHAKQLLKELRM